ncbi:MAG: ribosome recycling factor [Patescibacteria group bacterium]
MLDRIIADTTNEMDEVVRAFTEALGRIHTGRATSTLVEDIKVDYYNQRLPLKQLASISVQDPVTLVVTPWDKGALVNIEAGIRSSSLNFSPSADGSVIRITLPPLSAERRQEMIKLVERTAEDAKVGLRQLREQAWRQVKELTSSGNLTEDDRYRGEELLNKTIATYNDKLMVLAKAKEESVAQ